MWRMGSVFSFLFFPGLKRGSGLGELFGLVSPRFEVIFEVQPVGARVMDRMEL